MTTLELPPTHTEELVRGTVVRAHMRWVRSYFGERVMTRVLSLLPEDAAIEVNAALPSSWCALESLIRLDTAIATVCGRSERLTLRDLGRYTAHVSLAAFRESFRSDRIHAFFHSGGFRDLYVCSSSTCEWIEVSPAQGILTIRGSGTAGAFFCAGLAGFYEQAIVMHGGEQPEVVETKCRGTESDACVFEIRWR